MGVPWTEENLAKLRYGVEQEHLSARALAVVFNVSRNAIIGAAHRGGIRFSSRRNDKNVVQATKEQKEKLGELAPRAVKTAPTPKATVIKTIAKPIITPPPDAGVPIWGLEQFHCRAITQGETGDIENLRYCGGAKTFGKSYCAHHLTMYNQRRRPPLKSAQDPSKYTPKNCYR